ncbi:MAG TPA: hypothetical protein VJL29_02110, partial [Thermoguttaceae bacterium]|nr:hypothetical protein [Thermoguttaceae bacterium]
MRSVLMTGGVGFLLVLVGVVEGVTAFWAAGAALILYAATHRSRRPEVASPPIEEPEPDPRAARPASARAATGAIDPADTEGLVRQMLAQYRSALLLRPQIAVNLDATQFAQAIGALQKRMALVPDGDVTLGPVDGFVDDGVPDPRRPA